MDSFYSFIVRPGYVRFILNHHSLLRHFHQMHLDNRPSYFTKKCYSR
jgi:hypothetical protein